MNRNQPEQEKEGADEGGRQNKDTNCTGISRCAWAPGERMERFVRVPYGLYQGTHYGNTLPWDQPGLCEHTQPVWRQNTGAPTFLARPGLLVPTNASDYCMDPYKRAQLKAILSQMNPSLRLCKANSKEVGVQVSPRVDKSVQCSLGPLTLHSRSLWGSTGPKPPLPAWGGCSPVTCHGGLIPLRKVEDKERKALSGPVEASQQKPPPTPRSQEDKQEELWQRDTLGEEGVSSPGGRKSKLVQEDTANPLRKPGLQFLEPKYGYFHCKDCKTRWESAYVWCISGTNKVYFKQLCCKCQKSFNPYRVEAVQCQVKWARENYHHDIGSPYSLRLASADVNEKIIAWDVAAGAAQCEIQERTKPIQDVQWLWSQDASRDLLLAIHPPNYIVLWNADVGTKLWKKSYADNILLFSFDPFDPSHLTCEE